MAKLATNRMNIQSNIFQNICLLTRYLQTYQLEQYTPDLYFLKRYYIF